MKPYYMVINEALDVEYDYNLPLPDRLAREERRRHTVQSGSYSNIINIIMVIECKVAIEVHNNECSICSHNLLLFIFGIIVVFMARYSTFIYDTVYFCILGLTSTFYSPLSVAALWP